MREVRWIDYILLSTVHTMYAMRPLKWPPAWYVRPWCSGRRGWRAGGALLGNILLASIGPALPDHAEPGSPGRFARARRGSESVVRPGGFGTW